MKNLVENFYRHILEALELPIPFFEAPQNFQNVVIAGLGGSGIAGVMVKKMLENTFSLPIQTLSSYDVPEYVNEKTFFITASYSGDTEESLTMFEKAKQKGAFLVTICSGGLLEKISKDQHIPCILIPKGNPPRAAIAYSLVLMFRIFASLGLSVFSLKKWKDLALFLEKNQENFQKTAQKYVDFFINKIPIIYSSEKNEALAIRFRQQLSENSKMLAWHHVIPEMTHNEIMGWEGKTSNFVVLFLKLGNENEREKLRFDFLQETIEEKGITVKTLPYFGETFEEYYFSALQILDFISVFLAEKQDIDPTPVTTIRQLKDRLL